MRSVIKDLFKTQKMDAIISFSAQTRLWLAGVQTSAGHLFIEPSTAWLFVDGRYIEAVREKAANVQVELLTSETSKKFLATKNYKRIGVEGDYMTLNELETIKKWFPMATIIPFSAAALRIIKTPTEIKLIAMAGQIALQALEDVKPFIRPGISEKEVDAMLEKAIRMHGGEKGSFDAIVASGSRGSLPHGRASTRIIGHDEMVTIDFGAIYQGYCSDITRTFIIGTLRDQKLQTIYDVVVEAQKRGVAAVKPGMTTYEVDKICRDYITACGFGEYFSHSTGHGLGIDVHELPNVNARQETSVTLLPGMIITVEPGIYIPGLGGVRIEDDVAVTATGHRVLSALPHK